MEQTVPKGNSGSVFREQNLEDIYSEVQRVYMSDSRPWVVGYSGGKDSTAALQLVWNALARLPIGDRQKPIYVVASDTWVETPAVAAYIDVTLGRINHIAGEEVLPICAQKVEPTLRDSFWVCLIGRGYATGWH